MAAMTPESTQPAAPPPLASWWGHTGLLYTVLSVQAAVAGCIVAVWVLGRHPRQLQYPFSENLERCIQESCLYGVAIAVAQWLVLRRLVLRALCMIPGNDFTRAERRLVRNTFFWIVATVAGKLTSGIVYVLNPWIIVLDTLEIGFRPDAIFLYIYVGLIGGLILGTVQWLALRQLVSDAGLRRVPGAGDWIRWTTWGCVLASVIEYIIWSLTEMQTGQRNPDLSLWTSLLLVAVPVAIYTYSQSVCLKRLAPGWMKQLHERAQMAPAEVV